MGARSLTLHVLPGRLAVCRLEPGMPDPQWAKGALTAVVRTPGEVSVVRDEAAVPDGPPREPGWRALQVAGTLDLVKDTDLTEAASALMAAGHAVTGDWSAGG